MSLGLPSVSGLDEWDEEDEEWTSQRDHSPYLSALLGGWAPLQELRLYAELGTLPLGPWLTGLSQLRVLDVDGFIDIAIDRSLARLTALTRLSVRTDWDLGMAAGCLPASLKWVRLTRPPPGVLADSLAAAAGGLESLAVFASGGIGFSWAALSRFGALTSLSIDSSCLRALPAELTALTRLQQLKVEWSPLGSPDALAPAAALTSLTRLEILRTEAAEGLLAVPEGVLRLPKLKVRGTHCGPLGGRLSVLGLSPGRKSRSSLPRACP